MPPGFPHDVVFIGELNPRGMDGTNQLELLYPLILYQSLKKFMDRLDRQGAINKWHTRTMDEDICLCLHIDKTIMCTAEIGAVVGIFPVDTERIRFNLGFHLVERATLVLLN